MVAAARGCPERFGDRREGCRSLAKTVADAARRRSPTCGRIGVASPRRRRRRPPRPRGHRALAEHRAVDRLVAVGHPPGREPIEDGVADRLAGRASLDARRPGTPAGSTSSPKKPSTPSRMISGSAADAPGDDRRAAGQRLDRDETERLGPRAGHQRRVRLGEQQVAVGLLELAEELDRRAGRLERGQEDGVVVVPLGGQSGRPWRRSGAAGRSAARSRSPRRSPSPARPGRRSTARRPGAARTASRRASARCGRPRPSRTRGCDDAWFALIATRPGVGPRERLGRPTAGRAGRGRSTRPGSARSRASRNARPLEMAVDDVELVRAVEDIPDRQVEIRRRVAAVAGRPEGLRDGRDEASRHLRIAAGEGRHLMAAPIQLAHELDDRRARCRRTPSAGRAPWAARPGRSVAAGSSSISSSGQRRPWAAEAGPRSRVAPCRPRRPARVSSARCSP